ncbi:lysine N(6)-hydroxylase/L-ornithine N(5)-oxygenase family protein [Cryptosporangium arvum]|uniref:L-lysine N6-monooxygenase MbtG n=1 Tax=Cryptosporangium arvum DSM 44712 TaxID=927661 RepID=A0A010YGQ2_9ACTN|nr:lysine N(6)-hydroxylase/L-ornithine N(5)-oxygenase family protein [Cryptosporangium arvum]EXG79450.1 lysine/ornithine N-monooxygenase [Cryptosporangium arvum DSM 44712]
MSEPYDVLGIGIGPFNLSLAALAEPLSDVSAVFFDGRPGFSWHPGMLIEGATLQVPFLADLVTLVDPRSRWSFLSYLQQHDRLFPFYFAERLHVPRVEYDDYLRWVAESLPSCRFGRPVESISWDAAEQLFVAEVYDVLTARTTRVRARNTVVGVGTEPVVPAPLRPLLGKEVFHSAEYLDRQESLRGAQDITVLGSGQSGAEVFLDLLRHQRDGGYRLRWLTKAPAFAPMEYSKLGLEHFTPEYTRYFCSLPEPVRDALVPAQWQLYKAIDAETIDAIHSELYERTVAGGSVPVTMSPNVEVVGASRSENGITLECREVLQDRETTVRTDRVVAATGYTARPPVFLEPLESVIRRDAAGRFRIDSDYRVELDPGVTGGIYVQNAELHTHGVGTPDLGLGAHRAATILNALTGAEAYRLPSQTAFTTFGV